MKTLRKYANMAFLLISAATIVPAFANPTINEQEKVKQEEITVEPQKTETVWYKRPEVREKVRVGIEIAALLSMYAIVGATLWYMNPFKPVINRNTIIFKQNAAGENTGSNIIDNAIILGQIVQTDGKNTTIITPGKQPISIKQDSYGTWIKENGSDSWSLIKKYVNSFVVIT